MPEKMTIIVFSGEMDKVFAAFTLATTAATMGMEVKMFFTFWGLNVLRKETKQSKTRGIIRKMLNLMNRGGANRLPLSKFNMAGLGPRMMKKLMKAARLPSPEAMIRLAKQLGVKFIACTTTMGVMDISKEDLIPEVDELAGAATYLGEAVEGKINLFI